VLAFHDDRLDRLTDRSGVVARLPWSEVRRARIAGREPIVRLDELLASFPDARVNIDAKHDPVVVPLIRLLRAGAALERVCLGSFSDRRLAVLRAELGPDLCSSLTRTEAAALRAASLGAGRLSAVVTRGGGRCVQVPLRVGRLPIVDARLIGAAHALGLPVHAWTIDDPATMDALLDLGLDGLMTDRPAILRERLVARGAWFGGPVSIER
jgi:glycerophosphoryl diester phosphodiesterase